MYFSVHATQKGNLTVAFFSSFRNATFSYGPDTVCTIFNQLVAIQICEKKQEWNEINANGKMATLKEYCHRKPGVKKYKTRSTKQIDQFNRRSASTLRYYSASIVLLKSN